MLNRLPRQLPALSVLLDDLGHPPAEALGRALGVTPRTVRRWIADDQAPRPAALALFWVTRWGLAAAHAEAHNAATMHAAHARCLQTEVDRLRAELARVLALADTGAANVASLQALPLAPVLPFRRPGASPRPTGA